MSPPRVCHSLGYWNPLGEDGPAISPLALVDPGWAAEERALLVRYLRGGAVVREVLGYASDHFAGRLSSREMGCAERTDGTWMWPEGLAIYVERYKVRLPEAFLIHARANGFENPQPAASEREPGLWFEADPSFWFEWCAAQRVGR